jgi:GNAT superfamily N-acetyltransferase
MNLQTFPISYFLDKDTIINQLLAIEAAVWENPEWRVSRESLNKRINIFPNGFVVILANGIPAAFSSSMVTTYVKEQKNSWFDITDSGNLGNHYENGDTIWIVSMTVHPDYQSLGLGTKMLDFHNLNAIQMGKKLMVGTTPSGFREYNTIQQLDIHSYLKLKNDKGLSLDKKVRFYQNNGFVISDIVRNYMPDPDSEEWGCLLFKK